LAESRPLCKTRSLQSVALLGLGVEIHTSSPRSTGEFEAAVGEVGNKRAIAPEVACFAAYSNRRAVI
jgi:hypothetical protein